MDTDKFYTIFNTKITEFLNDLIRLFPDDADFKMYKTAITLAKLADEKKPLQYYKKFVTEEYKEHIRNKNDKFFLDHDYKEILSDSELSNEINSGDFSSQIVDRLKGYWSQISDENKEIVWNYFTLFLKISEKV
jgi:hypothetical protein|tara:strand:+ start:143 stop:544 length:402 start_codon:yes stop_codon:yes gene_type:complete